MSDKWEVSVNISGAISLERVRHDSVDEEIYGDAYGEASIAGITKAAQEECDKRNKELEDKKFDITKYEFDDGDITKVTANTGFIDLKCTNTPFDVLTLTGSDSQAIARHFYDKSNDKEAFINKIKGESND